MQNKKLKARCMKRIFLINGHAKKSVKAKVVSIPKHNTIYIAFNKTNKHYIETEEGYNYNVVGDVEGFQLAFSFHR